jgi:type IV pilus assembly protein PilM
VLEPVVIEVKPFSLLRSLKGALLGEHLTKTTLTGKGYTEGNEVGVVLEIAASSTTITLVRGERVLMNRNVGVSGDDFTAALQRAFGLDFDSAEEVKLDYGTATIPTEDEEELLNFDAKREQFSPSRVYEALRPPLVDLTTEIRRSLEFFRVQTGDATIARMLATGGGAKLRGLPDAIGDALGVRVEVADPWLSVTVDERQFDEQYLAKIGPEFGVPLGLALRGVSGLD